MARQLATSTFGLPPDSYLYSLALAADGHTFATVASDDSLVLFDVSLKPRSTASRAHAGVSCLSSFETGFATAGRDGLVRCWDPRDTRRSTVELAEAKHAGFASIASCGHLIAAGTESTKEGLADVAVLLYDTRNPSQPVRSYVDSHTDTVTQLKFHPMQTNVLLSGSEDGLISLFDVSLADEDDALQQVLNPRAGVHRAGFLGPSNVYVLTADENFLVYSLGDPSGGDDDGSSTLHIGDVRQMLPCAYVIDILPGSAASAPFMAYGHHTEQTLALVELDPARSYAFGPKIDLLGAHADEVVRELMVLPDRSRALSCGEDGRVKVWDLSAAVQASDVMDVDAPALKRRRT